MPANETLLTAPATSQEQQPPVTPVPTEDRAESQTLLQTRLKVKRDVIFLPAKDGLMFYHENGYFSLKGKSLYPFVSKLLLMLDGGRTVADICAPLPPERGSQVISLIENLRSRGIFREHVPEDEDVLPESVKRHFQRLIDFIEHYADHPVDRFRKFRATRVLICGDGHPFVSLGSSLLRNGVNKVELASEPDEGELASLQAEIGELQNAGVDAQYVIDPDARNRLRDYDVVVYASTRPSLRFALELNQECRAAGVAFLPALALLHHNYLGPLTVPEGGVCWSCAFLRIAASESPERAEELWRSAETGEPLANPFVAGCRPAAQMLGNNAAFEIFKYRCGHLTPETIDGVSWQSLLTLESQRVRLVPHSQCTLCRPFEIPDAPELTGQATGADPGTEETEALITAWKPFVHSRLGILQALSGEDIAQIPLRSSIATFTPPNPHAAAATIQGFDASTTAEAMRAVLVESIRRYSGGAPDTRTLRRGWFEDLERQGFDPVRSQDLLLWAGLTDGAGEPDYWVPARSLRTNRVHHVPAAAVYPESAYNRGWFRHLPPAVTAGRKFSGILESGLYRALAYHRIASFPAEGDVLEWSAESLRSLGPELQFLLDSLARLGAPARVLELPGTGGVRVVLAVPEQGQISIDKIVVGFGGSLREAANIALTGAVGASQIESYAQAAVETVGRIWPPFPVTVCTSVRRPNPAEHPDQSAGALLELLPHDLDVLIADVTPPDVRLTNTLVAGAFVLRRADRAI